jgi:hypothetical protein
MFAIRMGTSFLPSATIPVLDVTSTAYHALAADSVPLI